MAEKSGKTEAGGKAAAEEKKKGKGMKLAIIGGLAVVLLAGGGYFAQGMLFPKSGETPKGAAGSKVSSAPAVTYDLKSFIVNLAGGKGRRYLKATMSLELTDADVQKEIEKKLPQLRDEILTVLSGKTFEEVEDTLGKQRLRREIVTRVNRVLSTGKAERVYFTEFVIQ